MFQKQLDHFGMTPRNEMKQDKAENEIESEIL